MRKTKYAVDLTEAERARLRTLIGQGQAPARLLTHARILLKANGGEGGPGVVLSDRVSLGNLELSAGQHMLTFTVTGTNSASSGFFVGVDLVELELVD